MPASDVITLVLGGVRSGKSEVAERLAGPGPGTYLATGLVAPDDDDFADRVARHRARRPPAWATVEEPRAVPEVLARLHGPVLLDALGTWVANDLRPDIDGLVDALVSRRGDTVVVSEEVGLGVHPVSEVGRLFADVLGQANRRIADVADRCLLVVAGRVIELPAGAGCPSGGDGPVPPGPREDDRRPGAEGPGDSVPAGAGVSMETFGPAVGGLRQAVGFLTPLGGPAAPGPAALAWFPVVGMLLGLVLGGLWWATEDRLGPLAAAALVVVADLALTGALHFDGLLDSSDGLLPHLPVERRLAVMADPNVGAFAVAAGGSALLLRTAALAALGAARPLLLAALWSLARTAMAVTALSGRYARSHGLASSFLPGRGGMTAHGAAPGPSVVVPAVAGAVLAVGLAAADELRCLIAVLAAGLGAAGVAALARRRIGGFTGDTLGAAGVVPETAGLLVAAAVLR
jgi:adenosyl cobinamide kinase/adenosyl cobinamide phosphate guanylyltransferase/cobalamin synthase